MAFSCLQSEPAHVAIGDRLDRRYRLHIRRLAEEMREAPLQLQVVLDWHPPPELMTARDFAVFRFEQRKQARFDREPRDLDRVGRRRTPAERTGHVDVYV